ncbi:hypothetical protein FOA52_000078 [Chlamydomonas sp. UWO 241]|nr:hypothetical protein FOA52_000078 [Chlamydomonas sp. UWO 241]
MDPPQQEPAPSYANAFQPSHSTVAIPSHALDAREKALLQKEVDLLAKEAQLKALENELTIGGQLKRKNWPRCFPMLYHDIVGEIPPSSRRVVREIYMCWYGFILCLSWNFVCASVMLGTKAEHKASSWFLTIVYFLLGVPLSFWMWYLAMYNAAKNDSSVRFIYFFLWFSVHTAFCIWASIAFQFSAESWSFSGWFAAIAAFDYGNGPGTIYCIGASLWTLESLYCLWCVKDVYLWFRGQGGIEQVKQEAAVAAFRQGLAQQASTRR